MMAATSKNKKRMTSEYTHPVSYFQMRRSKKKQNFDVPEIWYIY